MKLAIWSTTTSRENSTYPEMFRRQLDEAELADRIGIDQIWFFEHHLLPSGPVPSPNLLIAAAALTTRRIRFSSMVNILPFRHPLLVAEEAAMPDNLTNGRFDMGLGRGLRSGAVSRGERSLKPNRWRVARHLDHHQLHMFSQRRHSVGARAPIVGLGCAVQCADEIGQCPRAHRQRRTTQSMRGQGKLFQLIQRQQVAHAHRVVTNAVEENAKQCVDGGVVTVQPMAEYSAIDCRSAGPATV
jgi:hypothetical protein